MPSLHSNERGKGGVCAFGVYRSAMDFANLARSIDHPYDLFAAVPDVLLRWIAVYLEKGPIWVAKYRMKVVATWRGWAEELASDEKVLHESLESGVAEILKGKVSSLAMSSRCRWGWSSWTFSISSRSRCYGQRFLVESAPRECGMRRRVASAG